MSITDTVLQILEEQLYVSKDRIQLHSDLTHDLGADSLWLVEIVMAIEEEFNIEVPDEDAEKWRTPGDIVNYVTRTR